MTAAVSRSLFNNTSIQFVGSLPSELNEYTGDIDLSTLGTELAPITASRGGTFTSLPISGEIRDINP
jgi:hypothetical protein